MRFGAIEHQPGMPCYLAVAQVHRSLGELYRDTKWQVISGGWAQTLARAPAAIGGVKVKFGKPSLTAVLVPIELLLDPEDVEGWVPCPSEAELAQ